MFPNPKSYTDNPSTAFLDNERDLSTPIIVESPDLQVIRDNGSYNSTKSLGALNYFGNHLGILGYFVIDEPGGSEFPFIASYFADIKNFNPNWLRLTNLYPIFASTVQLDQPTGTPKVTAYNNYIEDYINITDPNVISFDTYPLWYNNRSPGVLNPDDFYYNLDIVSHKSGLHNLPWLYTLTPIYLPTFPGHNSTITASTIPQFNYEIFSSMTYGAKGLNFWSVNNIFKISSTFYCFNCWNNAITQPTFDNLANIFSQFTENEKIILNCKLDSVYHRTFASTIKPGTEFIPPRSAWANITSNANAMEIFTTTPIVAEPGSGIDSLAISFHLDNNSNIYFWVLNKSMVHEEYFHFNFKQTSTIISFLQNGIYENLNSGVVNLQPGEAKLFSLNRFYSSSKTFCNDVYSSVYKDEWANSITLGGTGCSETFNNGARKNFKGRLITLNAGVYINEGASVFFNAYEVKTGTIRAAHKSNEKVDNLAERDSSDINKLIVYPNPTKSGTFYIRIKGQDLFKDVKIRLLTINNNEVPFNIINFGNYYEIEAKELPAGVYLVEGKFNNELHHQKIVISN